MKMHLRLGPVVLALLLLSAVAFAADQPLAMANLSGSVAINGNQQPSGARAIQIGDTLESGSKSGATIVLGPEETLTLDQNSAIRLLRAEGGVRVELSRGRVQVAASQNRLQDVRLSGRSVSMSAPAGRRSQYTVSRLPQGDFVYARLGSVSLREEMAGKTTTVPEGSVGVLDPTPAPQGGDHAGKVGAAIPQGYIMRASQKSPNSVGDDIRWNDELVTESKGRTRVALDDGSILSVGSNSHMKVVQHDANAQQTQLELTLGRMRVQAQKLTKPGATFTVKTPTAVAGVVGTDFVIEYDGKRTKVLVLEGLVKLSPLAAAAAVSIAAGQTGAVAGSAATTPVASAASEVNSAVGSTSTSATAAGAAAGLSTAAVVAVAAVPAAATAIIVPQIDNKPSSPSTP